MCRVSSLGFKVEVEGLGLGVGFKVQDVGARVLGFRV